MRLQIAFDYLMVFSFVMLVFVLLFSTIAKQRIEFSSEQSFAQLQIIAQVISTEIANAGQAGNGYSATFKLPSELSILAYNVSITKYGSVIVSTDVFGQTVKAVSSGGQYNVVSNSTYLQPPSNTYYNIPTYSGTGSITLQNAFGSVCVDYSCPSSVAQPTQISFSSQQTKALKLNGLNSYAIVPPQISLSNGFTFSAWVRRSPNDSNFQELFNNNQFFIRIESTSEDSNRAFAAFVKLSNNSVEPRAQDSSQVTLPNKWYFVSATWDKSILSLYVNGVLVANSIRTGALISNPIQAELGAGEQVNPFINYLNGQLSNVQIYGAPLSSQQIYQLYQEGITGSPISGNNLAVWYPLNGNGKDYSGNYANLAFVGQHSFPSVSQLRAAALNGTGSAISNA
ncbi:MAG: LamG domain-containing protein, partial [Candidatus Micrarchaeaceae archaeon]